MTSCGLKESKSIGFERRQILPLVDRVLLKSMLSTLPFGKLKANGINSSPVVVAVMVGQSL